ncbi:MAG: hypothetical protein RLO51_25270 [Thalassobaculum sp.]|uniref:hypothetical protein n=1 Tax=Thalassobaculum sp. TaxID=2022740 RepID=UPI0032EE82CD
MPLIDLYLSETVLDAEARQVLADEIARLVRAAEGYGDSRLAASLSWVYLHPMPETQITRSGAAPARPLWRIEVASPAGSLAADARPALAGRLAGACLAAEGTPWDPAEARRVWVLFRDVAEGDWIAGTVVARVEAIRGAVAREMAAA